MTKRFHKILGKFFLFCTACAWFGCDNSNGEFPASPSNNFANENSSSNEKNFSSEQLSSNAGLSSSSVAYSSSFVVPKPFIDVEQELAKITPTDTTGLRGQCILENQYCETIENYNASINYRNRAIGKAKEKLSSLINTKQNINLSERKKKCYNEAIGNGMYPVYGVSWCSNPNREKKYDESCDYFGEVHIDEAYFNALQKNDSLERYVTQQTFESINEKIAKCDNP